MNNVTALPKMVVLSAVLGLWQLPASAGPPVEGTTPCQYVRATGALGQSGECSIAWGGGVESLMPFPAYRVILNLPDGKSSVVLYQKGDGERLLPVGTANDITATFMESAGRAVVLTEEGEVFVFNAESGERPPPSRATTKIMTPDMAIKAARGAFDAHGRCRYRPFYIEDEDAGDKACRVTWRHELQDSTRPDNVAWLVRLYCDSGAYNFTYRWHKVGPEGFVRQISFARPSFRVLYKDENNPESDVEEISVVGWDAGLELVNSEYDPSTRRISATTFWRGVGDATTHGVWRFAEGTLVLSRFEVDASYNREIDPLVIYEAN